MIRLAATLILMTAGLPAQAGVCITQGEALSCTDAGETIILKGGDGARYGKLAGEKLMLTKDAQGNTFGIIGDQKLIIQRSQGMSVAKFGNRKMICAEAGSGITVCK